MTTIDGRIFQEVGGGLCSVGFYALLFWRTFKKNPGNRVVECGVITVAVFIAGLLLTKLQNPPIWMFASWLILVFLLCLSTLFFVFQRAYRAIRRNKDA